MTSAAFTDIREISHSEAKSFIEQWHYSKRCPTGKNIFYGWFVLGFLYAVADYGIGVNTYQAPFLSKISGYRITSGNLVELKRLCRVEPAIECMPLTLFLSKCHRLLKNVGYCYVVSFSDPHHGHSGGIYKAANFTHFGQTNAENHALLPSGEIRHRKYYFRYARRNNITVEQARNDLGLTLVKTLPKDRWLLQINKPKRSIERSNPDSMAVLTCP